MKGAAMNFDWNLVRIATTLLSMAIFIGICRWAWAQRNRANFDAAAQLPFDDHDATPRDAA